MDYNYYNENDEIKDTALFAALSYIPFLSLFLIMYKRDNVFMHTHAKQSLVVFIIFMFNTVMAKFVPSISFLFWIFNLVILFVIFYCIFAALMGKYAKIPIISDVADKIII